MAKRRFQVSFSFDEIDLRAIAHEYGLTNQIAAQKEVLDWIRHIVINRIDNAVMDHAKFLRRLRQEKERQTEKKLVTLKNSTLAPITKCR